jgi:hypothetical protein
MKTRIEIEDLRLLRFHSEQISKRQAQNRLRRIVRRVKEGKIQL